MHGFCTFTVEIETWIAHLDVQILDHDINIFSGMNKGHPLGLACVPASCAN